MNSSGIDFPSSNGTSMDKEEYLLKENPNRFVIFPIKHNDIWESFQTHRKAFWVESEVDLTVDLKDWNLLNNNEKHFIKNVLAFFAASDGIIMENLGARFIKDIQIPEARCFYSMQMLAESIHSIMYSQLIDTYITDASEKNNSVTKESNLLKLSCDKANILLEWFPTLNFNETIKYTSEWYINYINKHIDVNTFTNQQIDEFEKKARSKKLAWSLK